MSAPETLSTYSAMLKEFYTPDRVAKLILERSPLLAMLPKRRVDGKYTSVPVIYAQSPGRSATFSSVSPEVSGGVAGSSSTVQFQIETAQDYALATISRKVMLASQGNAGAFLPAAKVNIDGAMAQLRRSLGITLYRSGSGSKGRILSGGSGTTWTLYNREDAVNFQVGERLVQDDVDGGGTVGTQVYVVEAVNRSAGTLTVDTATSSADDNYLFSAGDYDKVQKGLAAWIPDSAPGATTFFGVNRSVDTDALGGVRFDGSGQLRYEALIDAQSECSMIGDGRPTHAFCNPVDFRQLVKELEAQVQRTRQVTTEVPVRKGSSTTVGFTGISIVGDGGEMTLYADRFCPPDRCYLLTLDEWRLAHNGPELVEMQGRDSDDGMLIRPSADGFEIRCISYPQLYTTAPGHNAVITNWGL